MIELYIPSENIILRLGDKLHIKSKRNGRERFITVNAIQKCKTICMKCQTKGYYATSELTSYCPGYYELLSPSAVKINKVTEV